jgi:hypothetical protein
MSLAGLAIDSTSTGGTVVDTCLYKGFGLVAEKEYIEATKIAPEIRLLLSRWEISTPPSENQRKRKNSF